MVGHGRITQVDFFCFVTEPYKNLLITYSAFLKRISKGAIRFNALRAWNFVYDLQSSVADRFALAASYGWPRAEPISCWYIRTYVAMVRRRIPDGVGGKAANRQHASTRNCAPAHKQSSTNSRTHKHFIWCLKAFRACKSFQLYLATATRTLLMLFQMLLQREGCHMTLFWNIAVALITRAHDNLTAHF